MGPVRPPKVMKNTFCLATAHHGSVVLSFVIPSAAEGSAVLEQATDSNESAALPRPGGRTPHVKPSTVLHQVQAAPWGRIGITRVLTQPILPPRPYQISHYGPLRPSCGQAGTSRNQLSNLGHEIQIWTSSPILLSEKPVD